MRQTPSAARLDGVEEVTVMMEQALLRRRTEALPKAAPATAQGRSPNTGEPSTSLSNQNKTLNAQPPKITVFFLLFPVTSHSLHQSPSKQPPESLKCSVAKARRQYSYGSTVAESFPRRAPAWIVTPSSKTKLLPWP
jgi:hypothetical protein